MRKWPDNRRKRVFESVTVLYPATLEPEGKGNASDTDGVFI